MPWATLLLKSSAMSVQPAAYPANQPTVLANSPSPPLTWSCSSSVMALSSAPMFLLCMACLDGRCRRRRTEQLGRAAGLALELSHDSRDSLRSPLMTRAAALARPDRHDDPTRPS